MRFTFIEQHVGTFPVRLMCRVLEVSPSGFYAWRSRPESERAASDRHLLAKVHRLQAQHHGRYGSPRMHAALRAEGHSCSRGRVERMMRRHDIRALASRGFARARPTVVTPSRSPQTCGEQLGAPSMPHRAHLTRYPRRRRSCQQDAPRHRCAAHCGSQACSASDVWRRDRSATVRLAR
jgi:putative transposase